MKGDFPEICEFHSTFLKIEKFPGIPSNGAPVEPKVFGENGYGPTLKQLNFVRRLLDIKI